MFRNRRSSQKPNDELYAAFKQKFPNVGPNISPSNQEATSSSSSAPAPPTTASLSLALTDSVLATEPFDTQGDIKHHDLVSRDPDHWRFTPGILDSNSFSFSSFANAQGYYTPTPGGMNTVYHNQAAGDLHTPGLAFQLGTPLSMPLPDSALNVNSSFDIHGFHPQLFQNQAFHNSNPFTHDQHQHQPAFPPSMLVHHDSGYDNVEDLTEKEQASDAPMKEDVQLVHSPVQRVAQSVVAPAPTIEKFRYHVTLNAPTAMIRHPDEIPITYLNKGQAYTVSIVDSKPFAPSPGPVKYRTVIRISFEDDQQRQRPSACWQLWKEGRGLAEAPARGGKLQAVEFVDPHPGAEEDPRRPRIELETASFDCFSVIWTPSIATSSSECSVAVRFNFLSTDFSHSKGVKGIPVRLCAKTQVLLPEGSQGSEQPGVGAPEVCYCKVKLFRDHGAERKLSNDVAHVKKTIEKLKQQIAQVEAGVKDFGKRKRAASMLGKSGAERPAKMVKHKRTWSISSQGSGGRPAIEEDLHQKLVAVQDMFTSTRPVSVLYLKGLEEDDPDLFPVTLPGERFDPSKPASLRTGSWDQRNSGDASSANSSMDSPLMNLAAPATATAPKDDSADFVMPSLNNNKRQSAPGTLGNWPQSATLPATNFAAALEQARVTNTVKVRKSTGDSSAAEQWLDAYGVDPSYVPPQEPPIKPVACFYVLFKDSKDGSPEHHKFYRAIYLMQRTLGALISAIATKSDVDPARVQRSLRITSKGLQVLLDDEVIRELPEGQDMLVEFIEYEDASETVKHEHHQEYCLSTAAATDTGGQQQQQQRDPAAATTPLGSKPLEMRLTF